MSNSKSSGIIKFLLYLLVFSSLLIGLSAQAESDLQIVFNQNSIELAKGKTFKIVAEIEGQKAKFVWNSKDPLIATVSANGTVTGKGNGATTITCTSLIDEKEISGSVSVSVFTPVQGLKLPQAVTVDAGKNTEALTVTFTPTDASNQKVTWSSDNPGIVKVDDNGIVTGVRAGTCKVTATSTDVLSSNAKPKTASIRVQVLQPASQINVDQETIVLAKGKSIKITATVLPEDASNKKVQWESSNPKIVSVNNGTISGKDIGDTVVTVATKNADGSEIKTGIPVHVYAPVASIAIKEKAKGISLYPGESISLGYDIKPETAEYTAVKWESSDKSIATVNSATGTVKGIAPGQVTITATSTEPQSANGTAKKDTIKVKVLTKVSGFSLNYPTVIYTNENNKKISVREIKPANASNKKFDFISENSLVARINDQGVITPFRSGVITFTVNANDKQGATRTGKIWIFEKNKTVSDKTNQTLRNAKSSLTSLIKP